MTPEEQYKQESDFDKLNRLNEKYGHLSLLETIDKLDGEFRRRVAAEYKINNIAYEVMCFLKCGCIACETEMANSISGIINATK